MYLQMRIKDQGALPKSPSPEIIEAIGQVKALIPEGARVLPLANPPAGTGIQWREYEFEGQTLRAMRMFNWDEGVFASRIDVIYERAA